VVVEVLLFSCLVFVGMADYQFLPDMNDPVAKLRLAMDRMDGAIHLSSLAALTATDQGFPS
jgi:hypothetical protein